MRLGVNTVLFCGFDFRTAMQHIKWAGYGPAEISAIQGMCEHLRLDAWQHQAAEIKAVSVDLELPITAMEEAALDEERLLRAFEAGAALDVPVVNIGPGGSKDNPSDLDRCVDLMAALAEKAEPFGVTLCVKAHVGAAIWNTPTTLKLMEAVTSPAFGIDMDPSHIYRSGENPVEALAAVIHRVKHVHIRDCKGRQMNPGKPEMQANGRGDIDLLGYIRVLHENGYTGPLDLEVIGAKEYSVVQCAVIAAESRGHMQACLQACGAR